MASQIRRHGCVIDGSHEKLEDENRRLKKMYAEEKLKAEMAAAFDS
jgi:hypothetical protein